MHNHNRSKNGCKCFIELKGYFKTEAHEDTEDSKANYILQSADYDGNRKFTLEYYYNLVAKAFIQLEESGTVYKLTETHNINSFQNGQKKPTAIKFSITAKRE